MSNVPKGKRKSTRFETRHNLIKVRDEITKLCINDFGFSIDKAMKRREKYEKQCVDRPNKDEIMARYDKKMESFDRWFIDHEATVVVDLLRDIQREYTLGNSIYPSENISGFSEYIERRKHISKAIGLCYTLKEEIYYIFRTLPVDNNKYKHFSELLDKQIGLFKGVKKSDNKLLNKLKTMNYSIEDILMWLLGDTLTQS